MKTNFIKSKQIPLEFQSNPKKFKKYHKIKYKVAIRDTTLSDSRGFNYIFTKHTNLDLKQALVILKLLKPYLKDFRRSRLNLNFKLDTILTKKPKDIRMGRGKGAPSERVFTSHAGNTFFSLYGLSTRHAVKLMTACSLKLKNVITINKAQ